jgi:hypothetical protein
MIQLVRFSALIFLLSCLSPAQQQTANPSPEEYAVMGVMLDGFRGAGHASHPIVGDYTSTFDCSSICNGMKVGHCNGPAMDDEAPARRLAIVKADMPDLEQATISDFEVKNRRCSRIGDRIPSQSPSFPFGADHAEKLPAGREHADFSIFLESASMPAGHKHLLTSASCLERTMLIAEGSTSCFAMRMANGFRCRVPSCGS